MFCVQSVWLENCNLERSSLNALVGSALGGDGSYPKSSPKPSEAVRPVDHANVVQQRWLMYQVSLYLYLYLYLYFRTCTGNCIDAVFFTTSSRHSAQSPPPSLGECLSTIVWAIRLTSCFVHSSTFPRGGNPEGVHRCAEGCGVVDHSVIIVGWVSFFLFLYGQLE